MIQAYLNYNKNVKITRHCEERSDEAIHGIESSLDCRGATRLAMTTSFLRYIKLKYKTWPNKIVFLISIIAIFLPLQAQAADCDRECLVHIVQQYQQALLNKNYASLPWGDKVAFTENDVALMIGDGLWGTATKLSADPYILADTARGNVLWMGVVEEHGQAAYYGLRLRVRNRQITEVESILGREGTPGVFTKPDAYKLDGIFSRQVQKKSNRRRLTGIVKNYYRTKALNDGKLYTRFTDNCSRRENGVSTTTGDQYWAAKVASGCRKQFEIGLFKPTDSIRAVRFPVVDEATGVVAALSIHDYATRYTSYQTLNGQEVKVPLEYPHSFSMLELFKIEKGAIRQIESFSAFQPYLMPSRWPVN